MRRFGWIGNLFVQAERCRVREVEDKPEANSSQSEPDERHGEHDHDVAQAGEAGEPITKLRIRQANYECPPE
jgi:hypothetical protein